MCVCVYVYCIVLYCVGKLIYPFLEVIWYDILCNLLCHFCVIAIDVERPIFRWTPWEAFQDHFEEGGMCILMERWLFVTNLQELLKSLTVQHRELALRENKPAGGLPPCFCFYFGKRESVPVFQAEILWNDKPSPGLKTRSLWTYFLVQFV